MPPTFRIILALSMLPMGVLCAHPYVGGLANETEAAFAGQVLLGELNCTACHAGDVSPKGAPNLAAAASRIDRDYLIAFLADPQTTHPGTTMPDLLGALPVDERKATAQALADYLDSLDPAEFHRDPIEKEAVTRGRELYHSVGCVSCHAPEEKSLPASVPLPAMAEKYSLSSLTAFLEDPLAIRPGGRMPDLKLDHWEAADLASYLLRDQIPVETKPTAPGRAVEGKRFFETLGCAQCHTPEAAKPDFARPLKALDASKNCASARFDLSDDQQARISAALGTRDAAADPIRLTLTRLNCIACHRRDDFGGPSPERDRYFTTTNLNLGDQARLPPPLTGVGAKLTPAWLRKVLVGGESARPYMRTRMPRFGANNVEHLIGLFAEVDAQTAENHEHVRDDKIAREAGFELVGIKGLSCVACHTFHGESATTLAGMELTNMPERLREDWFHRYLRAPQDFNPTTIMPAFWPGGKPVRPELLDGNAGHQIDAIWQYLSEGREARMPEGIRSEALEYGPANAEAVMLRRQYQGIGKRGIGVGYPSGINLAFDAAQLRLGTVWKGDFAEMSGVWRGQGAGNVGERGREIVRFPAGPAFALLDTADAEWPTLEPGEKAAAFQFQGYDLDSRQRPNFRYRIGPVEVTDGFIDRPDGPTLLRTLTFDRPAPPEAYFRLAADQKLKTGEAKNTYLLPHKLELVAPVGTYLLPNGELRLPLAGLRTVTVTYRFQPE